MTEPVDIDRLTAQLDELAQERPPSRARELRHQIQQQIAALLQEQSGEEGETQAAETADAAKG